jgi:transposase-like protein
MHCLKCKKGNNRKSGVIRERARYVCKSCNYTVEQRAGTADQETKRQALALYLEGLGFRAIGRVLKFSTVAILKWIRFFGAQVQDLRTNAPAKIVALDEMHTYIGSKKYCWIWSAVDRNAKRFRFKESCHRTKTLKRHQRSFQPTKDLVARHAIDAFTVLSQI